MWSPLLGHKQLKSKGLKDTSFPKATGYRGRWNSGLYRKNGRGRCDRKRNGGDRAFQVLEEIQGVVENWGQSNALV